MDIDTTFSKIQDGLDILSKIENRRKKEKIDTTILNIDKSLLILNNLKKISVNNRDNNTIKVSLNKIKESRKETDKVLSMLDNI
jgi:hypothetical protein